MARTTALPADEIQTTLGIDAAGTRIRLRRWLIGAVFLAGAIALAILLVHARGQEAGAQYRTNEVRRGNLTVSVTATGVLKPLTQVNVGTEMSGIVDGEAFRDVLQGYQTPPSAS